MSIIRSTLSLTLAFAQGPSPGDAPELVNPCKDTTQPYHAQLWCDRTQPLEARVNDMLKRMTLAEKIGNLGNNAAKIDSLGLPSYNWWSEATHGVASGRNDAKTPVESNFAFPITTAMSFNRSLWAATGAQIGREARAFMNAGNAYSTFWAPVVNLAREPRWGRNIETPGEDPYLSGEYATHFVQGFQESPDAPGYIQASACCKHYVANEMDSSTENGVHWDRNHFDANVTMQDLVDSYMVPFQACVEKGRVTSLMCSYNAVNGVPSCANPWLLQEVARDTWGFDGYITSDCDADSDVFNSHHYTATAEEAVRDVLRAGTDSDCGGFVQQHAQSALDKGLITEADIDARLYQLFKVRMRLGHFDATALDKIPTSVICSDYAKAVAREGSTQSATLLKNDGTLPLKAGINVAVVGPNANLSQAMAGYYGGNHPCGMQFATMTDAVAQYATVVPGADAVRATQAADTTVVVLGTDLKYAAEGHDAASIRLPEDQADLVKQVAAAAAKPIVVVTLTHIPLDIGDVLDNPKVGAVVHAGQPSVQTLGVGDVLFGKVVPAGRLVQTIYPGSYEDEISVFDFNMRPGPSVWPRPDCKGKTPCANGTNPGRTHRFYTGKAVRPFGFGLSYTTFAYSVAAAPSLVALGSEAAISYAVTVTNTGSLDADDVVLGFVTPPGAGQNGVPLQTLFGFERVHVKAGQSKTVNLYPAQQDFTRVDGAGSRQAHPGEYTVSFGVQAPGMGYATHKVTATANVVV